MKKFLLLFLSLALIITLAGPAQTASAATIKISQKSASVIKGDYLYLSLKGTNKKASWSSSNKYVATVSKTGKVLSISTGKATITAKVNGKNYSCRVTVIPKIDPNYMTDTDIESANAERNAIEEFTSKDSSSVSSTTAPKPTSSPSNRDIDGIASYYQGEVTIPKSDSEWITSKDLTSKYGYSMTWSSRGMSLKGESEYLLTGVHSGMTEGTIYECKYNDLTVRMKYSGDFYFNIADLKLIGLIKS